MKRGGQAIAVCLGIAMAILFLLGIGSIVLFCLVLAATH